MTLYKKMPIFKVGDIIEPVIKGQARHWYGMKIIHIYHNGLVDVEDKDGDIIEHFNINPSIGVEFKCVNH